MLLDYYNNPAHVANPHPPRYYFYGAGAPATTARAGPTISARSDQRLMTPAGFANMLRTDALLCATFRLKRVAYEPAPGSTIRTTCRRRPGATRRLTRTMIQNHDVWSNLRRRPMRLLHADRLGPGRTSPHLSSSPWTARTLPR